MPRRPKQDAPAKIPEKISIDGTNEKSYDWRAPSMLKVIEALGAHGYTNEEVAALLGVRTRTLNNALKKTPNLEEKLIKGRSEATQLMVAACFYSAVGGRTFTTKKTYINPPTARNPEGTVKLCIIEQEEQPNVIAQQFWLVNNDPQNWRHYRDVIKMNKKDNVDDNTLLESDKIARLSRKVFEGDSDGHEGKHQLPEATSHPTGKRTVDAKDVSADVSGETADHVQDDVLDVPTEKGTEHP